MTSPERRTARRRPVRPGVAAAVVTLGVLVLPGILASAEGPPDRQPVILPPVYPAAPPRFLRLPDTSPTPVPAPAPAVTPIPAPAPPSGAMTPLPPVTSTDRPVWTPSRTDTVPGLDTRGRPATILEYTPGRFTR